MAATTTNKIVFSPLFKDQNLSASRFAGGEEGTLEFDSQGYATLKTTHPTEFATLIAEQGITVVDVEDAVEVLTAGTVQTATSISALVINNGAAASVINLRVAAVDGDITFGPLGLVADESRVIVFGEAVTFTGGLYVQVVSGGLHATPGFLVGS